jgi:hypothetical protein
MMLNLFPLKKINNPGLFLIILFLISTSLLMPITTSKIYMEAIVRVQVSAAAEKGNEMSIEQQNVMAENLNSPTMRNITMVSTYVGGLVTFFLFTLLTALLLKLVVSSVKKDKIKFSLVLKVLLFATIVSMMQLLVKNGITLSGNWQRGLSRVNDMGSLQFALQSPISFAALFDYSTMNKTVYMLIDAVTDIFNWIYYIFLYAGLKVTIGLEKTKALIITIVIAVVSISIGLIFTSLV